MYGDMAKLVMNASLMNFFITNGKRKTNKEETVHSCSNVPKREAVHLQQEAELNYYDTRSVLPRNNTQQRTTTILCYYL